MSTEKVKSKSPRRPPQYKRFIPYGAHPNFLLHKNFFYVRNVIGDVIFMGSRGGKDD